MCSLVLSPGYVSWPRLHEARLIVAVYYAIDNHAIERMNFRLHRIENHMVRE